MWIIEECDICLQMATEQCVKAVIMTPTKELCSQAYKNIQVSKFNMTRY